MYHRDADVLDKCEYCLMEYGLQGRISGMLSKYKDLMKYISETDDSCGRDIVYSLELVRTSLDKTLKRVKKEISSATEKDSFEDIGQIAQYCQQIKEIDEMLKVILGYMDAGVVQENKDVSKPCSEGFSTKVNYEDYDVNKNEPHRLDEDFTNKKPYAIVINGYKIVVDSWKDALVMVCKYLYNVDREKIKMLAGKNKLRGREVSLFSKEKVGGRNVRLSGTDLYVWTKFSAKQITEYIIKLLEEYGISLDNVIVYLRRDLSPLHE